MSSPLQIPWTRPSVEEVLGWLRFDLKDQHWFLRAHSPATNNPLRRTIHLDVEYHHSRRVQAELHGNMIGGYRLCVHRRR